MKTAFQAASDAVEDALASDDNHPDDIARAVLLAVRGLDGYGIEAARWSSHIVDLVLRDPMLPG